MSAAHPPAKELKRITTRYVPGEDRVRLAGEREGGGQVAIWLTRRLLQGLVPKLLSPPGATPGAIAPHRELFLGFAQQKALAAQVPVAPVAPPADAESWLAERAAISRSPQALTVTFESPDGQAASLLLSPVAVHQWLAIVYRAYRSAEWPLDIWPAWLTENLERAPPLARVLH
jgi:hypothetical protein